MRIWRDNQIALSLAQRIVTPEDRWERQPHVDEGGRVIVFDGHLFDRDSVVRELGGVSELPDSVVAARWLEHYGPESLAQLRGDYALARWDPRDRRLVLAVSPMAGRLIYYHASPGSFWFATTLASLLRFPGVPRELDPAQLALLMIAQVVDPADTLYRGIRLLPQGTLLSIDASGVKEHELWRPDPTRRLRFRRDEDYVEAAREILLRAVKSRLRVAGPAGAMLSAGLDSSAVASTAARLLDPAVLCAYTAAPPPGLSVQAQPGWYVDERDGVRQIAALYPNLQVEFCHSDRPSDIERDPTPLFLASGRPYFLAHQLGWFDPLYRAAQCGGHTALLCGIAGNMTLSFDGLRGFGDLFRRGRFDLLARLLPPVARFYDKGPLSALFKSHVLIPQLPPRLRDSISRHRNGRSPWTRAAALRADFADSVGLNKLLWQAGLDGMFLHQRDSRVMQAHFLHVKRTRNLEHLVTIRAHYGVEERDPLADPDLVDFCLAIPREQYLLDGRHRSLARRVLADRLPISVTNNHRPGQQKPEWYYRMSAQREELAAEIDRLERVPLAAAMLDLPRMKALLADWPADATAARARRFDYESLLPRAVQMGRFLRWADGGNR